MNKLAWHDLEWALRRCPRPLLAAMKKHGDWIIVSGGYIRSTIANEPVNDVDVFVSSQERAGALAMELVDNDAKRVHKTANALTLKGFGTPIQIITRWTFSRPEDCIQSFDFTVARAAFWYKITRELTPEQRLTDPKAENEGSWESMVDERFYCDVASKRLIYCSPVRIEEAGGSMLRVLKFYQKGYRIPLDSLGKVIGRLAHGVEGMAQWRFESDGRVDEGQFSKIITGLLREVDPNIDPTHIAHLPSEEEGQTKVEP